MHLDPLARLCLTAHFWRCLQRISQSPPGNVSATASIRVAACLKSFSGLLTVLRSQLRNDELVNCETLGSGHTNHHRSMRAAAPALPGKHLTSKQDRANPSREASASGTGMVGVVIVARRDQQINSESSPTRLGKRRCRRTLIERGHRIKIDAGRPQHIQKRRHIWKSQRLPTSDIDVLSSIRNCTYPKSIQQMLRKRAIQ